MDPKKQAEWIRIRKSDRGVWHVITGKKDQAIRTLCNLFVRNTEDARSRMTFAPPDDGRVCANCVNYAVNKNSRHQPKASRRALREVFGPWKNTPQPQSAKHRRAALSLLVQFRDGRIHEQVLGPGAFQLAKRYMGDPQIQRVTVSRHRDGKILRVFTHDHSERPAGPVGSMSGA